MKVVYDSCLYIDLLRDERHLELFTNRSHIRYLAPPVVMELNAGAKHARAQQQLDSLFRKYVAAGRIIPLKADHFYAAGKILGSLLRAGFSTALANDILIAIAAQSIGATLFTANRRDFRAIEKKLSLRVEYL